MGKISNAGKTPKTTKKRRAALGAALALLETARAKAKARLRALE